VQQLVAAAVPLLHSLLLAGSTAVAHGLRPLPADDAASGGAAASSARVDTSWVSDACRKQVGGAVMQLAQAAPATFRAALARLPDDDKASMQAALRSALSGGARTVPQVPIAGLARTVAAQPPGASATSRAVEVGAAAVSTAAAPAAAAPAAAKLRFDTSKFKSAAAPATRPAAAALAPAATLAAAAAAAAPASSLLDYENLDLGPRARDDSDSDADEEAGSGAQSPGSAGQGGVRGDDGAASPAGGSADSATAE
jgi:hypothetical protein